MALIHTKLNRPPVAENFIARPRLEELLGNSLHKPLTLVTAPAGYGKSSLVSHQMQQYSHPNAWLSLDENDNDPGLFLSYFLAAVQSMFPDAVRETFALVNTPSMPTVSMLATSLINELAEIKQPFVLVLDDCHFIKEQSVHDLLTELLRYPPASMHLVLSSRRDSPLPFSSYRAKGLLVEIGPEDLRFSKQETAAYLSQALKLEVDPSTVAAWHEKTEGWVTGLQLAAISMSHHVETHDLPSNLLKDVGYLREYFYNEVFATQPPEVQHSLLRTAILDRFNAPLCEAVSVSDVNPKLKALSGWEFIAWLKAENLFLIPLDADEGWYRYHHLFRALLVNLLNRQCDQEQIALLHNRASVWFADNDLLDEALHHALAADNTERAVAIVVRAGFQLMDSQEWPRLQRWLSMLPHEEVEKNPELLILKTWLFHLRYNLLDMGLCLRKIEVMKSSSQPGIQAGFENVQGHYMALCSYESYMAADGEQALSYSQYACKVIPGDHSRARAFAEIFRLGAYQMLGDLEAGLSLYSGAMKAMALVDDGYQNMLMANLCFIYWMDADLISLRQTAECSLLVDHDKLLPETAAFGHHFLGLSHYCLNDLDRAEAELSIVIDDLSSYSVVNFVYSAFALTLIHQAKGKPGKARKSCESVVLYARQTNNAVLLKLAQGFTAELALRQGRLAEAVQWEKQFRPEALLPTYRFYLPQLTQVKILLAQDTTESRQQASDLLDELQAFQSSVHNKVFMIDVLALRALLHEAQDDYVAALDELEQAIALAEPGGWLRPFLDLGAPMKDLFVRLHEQGYHQDYARQILTAFGSNGFSRHDRRLSSYETPETLLTNREFDILKLAGQRLRDKEIAETASISLETVKAHMRNIRKKLNVSSRRDAVAKAIDLSILPPG